MAMHPIITRSSIHLKSIILALQPSLMHRNDFHRDGEEYRMTIIHDTAWSEPANPTSWRVRIIKTDSLGLRCLPNASLTPPKPIMRPARLWFKTLFQKNHPDIS